MNEDYYIKSGKFNLPSTFIGFIIALLLSSIVGVIYSYVNFHMPLIYFNIVIAFFFGIIIAAIVGKFIVFNGKVRNLAVAYISGFIVSIAAQYVAWIIWVSLVYNISDTIGNNRIGIALSLGSFEFDLYLLKNPQELINIIKEINNYGTWSLKGGAVNGIFLLGIWIIEFVLITVTSFYSINKKVNHPFNERTNNWYHESQKDFIINDDTDISILVNEIKQNKFSSLRNFNVSDVKVDANHIRVYLYKDPNDIAALKYLSLMYVQVNVDDKGKIKTEEQFLLERKAIKDNLDFNAVFN